MAEDGTSDASRALAQLERWGILLLQDATLPSLATLVAGEPVRGSWWGHAMGSRIFHAAGALEDHEDVATFRLIEGKVCFVHRRLWPALAAIGRAREPWQLARLDDESRALLARLDEEGRVRATGQPAKTLERAMLAVSREVHADSGAHARELSSWARFAKEREARAVPRRSVARAKAEIEEVVAALVAATGARARLPWR